VSVTFRLFDDAVAGNQVGSNIVRSVTPVDGLFSESLDFGVSAWAINQALWLDIEVDGDLLGRQLIEGAPYALNMRGMTVDASGNIGIGTAELDPSVKLHATTPLHGGIAVSGTATSIGLGIGVFGAANSFVGFDFYAGGSGTDYGSSSSIRWKHNLEPISRPLHKVSRLRGVSFDWDKEHGGHHDVGMIAEEVGEVLPEIVSYEENGIDAVGMDYSRLTPLLVEAIKEQQMQIETQAARIAALESTRDDAVAAPVEEAPLAWPVFGVLGLGVIAMIRRHKMAAAYVLGALTVAVVASVPCQAVPFRGPPDFERARSASTTRTRY
jgi:hypothetical protein